MKKIVCSISVITLMLSSGVTAEAAIKKAPKNVKVKSGKLLYKSTNKVVKGYVTYKSRVYKDGKLFTGITGNTYYKKGQRGNGVYKNKLYKNGKLYTGKLSGKRYEKGVAVTAVLDGVQYKGGKPATGTVNGIYYQNGRPFTGVVNQIVYEAGIKPVGYKVYDHHLYKDGDLSMDVVKVNNIWYAGGQIASGKIVSLDGEELFVNNGLAVEQEAGTEQSSAQQVAPTDQIVQPTQTDISVPTTPTEIIPTETPSPVTVTAGFQVVNGILYKDGARYDGKVLYNDVLYKNGQPISGLTIYDGKYYQNGVLATGTFVYEHKNIAVQNGVLQNGVIDGRYYKNGQLATGVVDRVLYKNGVKATGEEVYNGVFYRDGYEVSGVYEKNGLYYAGTKLANGIYELPNLGSRYLINGALANGLHKGVYYEDGERQKGYALIGGKLYKDGMLNTGVHYYDGKWYYNDRVANGLIQTEDGQQIAVNQNGEGITGKYQNAYYTNGKLESGYVLRDGELYVNGRPNNAFVSYNGLWYARTKPANGVHTVEGQTIMFENGRKFSGIYAERLYEDGVLKRGTYIYNGILYVDGIVPVRTLYNDKLYVNGVLATTLTEYDGKLYGAGGTLVQGKVEFDYHLYNDGILDTVKQDYNGHLYTDGKIDMTPQMFDGKQYEDGSVKS